MLTRINCVIYRKILRAESNKKKAVWYSVNIVVIEICELWNSVINMKIELPPFLSQSDEKLDIILTLLSLMFIIVTV